MNELDDLRTKALELALRAAGSENFTRRPSWAPRLLVDAELQALLLRLGWIEGKEPAVRLWSCFTDPRRHNGKVTCDAFELRAGETRVGKKLCVAQFFDKPATIENLKRTIETTSNPYAREYWEDVLARTEAKNAGWSFGSPLHSRRRDPDRDAMLKRVWELGKERIAEFAGAADEQMRAAGKYYGHCCCCGKALTDPVSIDLGIGPECRHKNEVSVTRASLTTPDLSNTF